VDKVRPENVSFQKVMQQRIQRYEQPLSASAAAENVQAGEATPKAPASLDENKEMKQTNVLYSLLDDRLARQYPIPSSLRTPASNPTHYDDLIREMEEAPTRSWFANFSQRVKGTLRFK